MKLYSSDLSPFASRPRVAIYAKNLSVEILPPAGGGTKTSEYLAINPMGRLPALVLDDGTVIPESDTIVEYLADAFPEAGLRPSSAKDIARGRLIARVTELYVMTPGAALFAHMSPANRDEAAVEAAFVQLDKGLTDLNVIVTDDAFAVGDSVTTADCALAPIFFFVGVFGMVFQRGDVLAKHGKVAAYWARARQEPGIAKVLGEMQAALQARMAGQAA